MNQVKEKLREQLKAKRQAMHLDEVKSLSLQITENFFENVNLVDVNNLHIYLPIRKYNEIDTSNLLKGIWREYPKILTATWQINEDGEFVSIVIDSKTLVETNDAGYPQPVKAEELPEDFQFDMIIVPTLGFDSYGFRLGSGAGFYDKWLAGQESAITIGLCYEFGWRDEFPHEPHDIPLQQIITETT